MTHISSEQLSAWIAGDRPADAALHLAGCAKCRAEIAAAEAALTLFRDSGREWAARCEAAPLPARRAVWPRAAFAAALAASILVAAVWIQRPGPSPAEEPFVRIPYVAPLAPYERTMVVRAQLPVAALIAAGFEVRVPDAGVTIDADVLIGQDGRAHAIRPAFNSHSDRRTN